MRAEEVPAGSVMSPRASAQKQFTSLWTLGGLTPFAGAHGLSVGLYLWILSALLAVGYFLLIYTMFRGKVRMEEGGYATFGYQINGDSILAGNVTADTSAHLPNIITYTAGADIGITRHISASADFLGQALLHAEKISQVPPVTDFVGGSHPNIATSTATVNEAAVAVGGKVSPFGRLLITADVLFRVNDAGLHYKPAPLVGVSYSF